MERSELFGCADAADLLDNSLGYLATFLAGRMGIIGNFIYIAEDGDENTRR